MRSRAAIRYSKAIFQIATESKSLSMVKKDMDAIITAHKSSNDFKKLLKNSLIKKCLFKNNLNYFESLTILQSLTQTS